MNPTSKYARTEVGKLLSIFQRHPDFFRRCSVPILFDDHRGRPIAQGTALVIRLVDTVFLVSAAHVFDPLERGEDLYIYGGCSQKRKLTGQLHRTSKSGSDSRRQDRLDIGVFRMSGENLPPYPDIDCFPLPFHGLHPIATPREGKSYLAIGYPTTKATTNVRSRTISPTPYANYGTSVSGARYGELGLNESDHIAIHFHSSNVIGANGNKQKFPDPHGMSGSPVWLVNDDCSAGPLSKFLVSGILIEYRPESKILVATDIAVAMHLLIDAMGGPA